MQQHRHRIDIANSMILQDHRQKKQQKCDLCRWILSSSSSGWYSLASIVGGMIVVAMVVDVMVVSPHPIRHHHIVDCKDFVAAVTATRSAAYSMRTKGIHSRTTSNGWIMLGDIPRGGQDAIDHKTLSTNSDAQEVKPPEKSAISSSVVSTARIIRIRMVDGTIQKVAIPSEQWTTPTVLSAICQTADGSNTCSTEQQQKLIQPYNVTLPNGLIFTCTASKQNNIDGDDDDDDTHDDKSSYRHILKTSLYELGFKHGSLVTIHSNTINDNASSERDVQSSKSKWMTSTKQQPQKFDPYPELAKDYDTALRNAKIRRNTAGGLTSYASLAALQSSLHIVEPQSTGTIQRIYMCYIAATKFQARYRVTDPTTSSSDHYNGVALLLGTITTERKDLHQPRKARTSLSSTVESDQYCCAARVHAIWVPSPPQPSKATGPSDVMTQLLQHFSPIDTTNVIRVAQYLGLQPIGWIFSYSSNRTTANNGDGGLPVWGTEIEIGAQLQIEYMKKYCQDARRSMSTTGSDKIESIVPRFGTLAMDARTGATEAFQISDVAVQMVAENMFVLGDNITKGIHENGRYITTRHPVIVDGKETNQLDSVLCLVNVALLSHTGMYSGPPATTISMKKRDGKVISNKIRKAILKAMDNDDDTMGTGETYSKIFEIISDFSILLALDSILTEQDSEQLCKTLYKWARGQKKSVILDRGLKETLRRALDTTTL